MALRVLGQLSSTAPRRPESRRRPQRKPPERRPLAAATHREGSASHHLQDVQFGFFCKKPAGASASRAGAGCGGAGKRWVAPAAWTSPLGSQGPPPHGLDMGESETQFRDWQGPTWARWGGSTRTSAPTFPRPLAAV